jgi:hypothetical protein
VDDELAALPGSGDAVLYRVLHQGLQEEGQRLQVIQGRLPVPAHPQPLLQPHGLHAQVVLHQGPFFPEGEGGGLRGVQDPAQQARHGPYVRLRLFRILLDEFRQCVQGVEEDVGVELALELAALGLRDLGAHGAPVPLAALALRDQVAHEEDGGTVEAEVEHVDRQRLGVFPGQPEHGVFHEHQGRDETFREQEGLGAGPPGAGMLVGAAAPFPGQGRQPDDREIEQEGREQLEQPGHHRRRPGEDEEGIEGIHEGEDAPETGASQPALQELGDLRKRHGPTPAGSTS